MEFRRSDEAPASWAADELRQRLMGIEVVLTADDGETVRGILDNVQGETITLLVGASEITASSARIVAFSIVPEIIDHSDELGDRR